MYIFEMLHITLMIMILFSSKISGDVTSVEFLTPHSLDHTKFNNTIEKF